MLSANFHIRPKKALLCNDSAITYPLSIALSAGNTGNKSFCATKRGKNVLKNHIVGGMRANTINVLTEGGKSVYAFNRKMYGMCVPKTINE